MRVAGFHGWNNAARVESVNGLSIAPTFVNGTLLNRSTTSQDRVHLRTHLQADVVASIETGSVKHRLLVGGEWSDAPDIVSSFGGSSSAIDPFNLSFPGTAMVPTRPTSRQRTNNRQKKVFALETMQFLEDKLIVSFGGSAVSARTSSLNILTNVATVPLSLTEWLIQYDVVYKVLPELSIFYGYNENFAPNFQSGQVLPSQLGQQTEVGIKREFDDGRFSFNVANFDIQQENVPVLSFPQTTPPSFCSCPDKASRATTRTSHGR